MILAWLYCKKTPAFKGNRFASDVLFGSASNVLFGSASDVLFGSASNVLFGSAKMSAHYEGAYISMKAHRCMNGAINRA